MYIIKVSTYARQEFFGIWTNEIHAKICRISGQRNPIYLVFAGHQCNVAYVYTDNCSKLPCDGCMIVNPLTDEDLDADAFPVHCNPEVDMCTTSLGELNKCFSTSQYSDYAIEDVTIGNLANMAMTMVPAATLDDDVASMQLFVNTATRNYDTSTLMSFINYLMVSRGYDFILYPGLPAQKHTMLEVRSEMMRCNYAIYSAYKHRNINNMLTSIIDGVTSKAEMEYRISGIVHEVLFDNVVSSQGSMWCFHEGLWTECADDAFVWNFLTNDFIGYLQCNNAHEIAHHMMSNAARSKVMKDVKMRLQDERFYGLLDSKRVVRMTNGIYNTNTGTLMDPVPSDYVSVVSGVPYQVFDTASHEVNTLMHILGTIFPNPSVLDFFLLSCGTFLEGYNAPKVFYVWWGAGNNAKTLVQTLVMRSFGDYCSTAPTSLVTGQRTNSSNATPELCHVEKRLIVFLQEPNPEETIRAGKMKEMTGNDSMYVRQLFKAGKTITLKAKMVLVCNNIVDIPGMDAAVKRRLVVIPFDSTFLSTAEYRARKERGTLEPNSYIIKPSVEQDLLNCKAAFMYIVCRKFSEFKNAGYTLQIPQEIKKVTDEYITRNNRPLIFINSFLHPVDGSVVAAADIYEMFKQWFKRLYPMNKLRDFESFSRELSNEGYKEDNNGMVVNVFMSYSGD